MTDYTPDAPPAEAPHADAELYALGLTELASRYRQLQNQLAAWKLRVNALEVGPRRFAATEEQWTQLWLIRMAMYVDRGRQSPRNAVQKLADRLATVSTRLLEELEVDQQQARTEARRQELLAELATLDPPKRKGDTKTIGGRAAQNPAQDDA